MSGEDLNQTDFCRVCRCEGTSTRPLFHPCMCTGSIKYIHQDCLLQWLRYSKRHTCELCHHRFAFAPIYASGTPRFIPFRVLLAGVIRNVRRSVHDWLHLVIVFLAWLVVVPLTACRIYRCLFTGSVSSLLTLPLDMLSTRHLLQDCLQGFTIVILASAAFLGYISLREQLLQGGGPAWLEQDAAAGNDGEANERRHMFPDLFNLFGAANGVGGGDGAAVPDAPPAAGATTGSVNAGATGVPGTGGQTESEAVLEPQQAPVSSQSSTESAPSTSRDTAATTRLTEERALQPQQMGWRADGLGESDAWTAPNTDHNVNGTNQPGLGPQFDDPNVDNGDGVGMAADAGELGDEMNWDRLLGLDGSLAFLEHVLWLIALDTLFIVIFAFCPYHMGQFTVIGFKLEKLIAITHMEGLSTGIIGYLIFAGALVIFHFIFRLFGLPNACYWTGLCYVYIKVALVSLLELGIFPVLCGLWIDACTLSLFNSTLSQRAAVLHHAPLAFTFIHWATGMLYIFYMASLLILARRVVRPGVLRFVYHFNDPDFKPVQDMIMQPLHIYLQRLIATYSIWGILIVFMLWLPLEGIRRLFPGFLPYKTNVAHESPLDYSVEIILMRIVLPFLLNTHVKSTIRQWLRGWCVLVSWLLNIRSFLLGDVPLKPGDFIVTEDGEEVAYHPPASAPHAPTTERDLPSGYQTASTQQPLDDEHDPNSGGHPEPSTPSPHAQVDPGPGQPHADEPNHAPPHVEEDGDEDFTRFIPYKRTSYFTLRLCGFLLIVLVSLMLLSTTLLVLPVGLGRLVFRVISTKNTQKHDAVALVTGFTVLGFFLRITKCLPTALSFIRQSLANLAIWFVQVFYSSRRLHVLRIWTRSGTTCEIAIPRPALPAPVRPSTAAPVSSGTCTASASSGSGGVLDACTQRLCIAAHLTLKALRLSFVAFLLFVLLPVSLGLLINLVFITPFQVGYRKTLILGFWEHWIFGIMHLNVAFLITMAGPSWWLRRRLEAIQNELVTNRYHARSLRILSEVAPVLVGVSLSLALPYLFVHYVVPEERDSRDFALRYIYPFAFLLVLGACSIVFHIKQLQKLYRRIKDEQYLIDQRLVNFGQTGTNSETDQALLPSTVSTA